MQIPPHLRSVLTVQVINNGRMLIGADNYPVVAEGRSARLPSSQGANPWAQLLSKIPNMPAATTDCWVSFVSREEEITQHDIDVSYDGKKWFHLFGDYCLTNGDPFSREMMRQCNETSQR